MDYTKGPVGEIQESGVVIIDKARGRNCAGLLVACYLNSKNIRDITYGKTNGDKETFWVGFEVAEALPYAWNVHRAGNIGWNRSRWMGIHMHVCSGTMLYVSDCDTNGGRPLWLNGGLEHSKYQIQRDEQEEAKHNKMFEAWMFGGNWEVLDDGAGGSDFCMNTYGIPFIPLYGSGVRSFNAEEERVLTETTQHYHVVQQGR